MYYKVFLEFIIIGRDEENINRLGFLKIKFR